MKAGIFDLHRWNWFNDEQGAELPVDKANLWLFATTVYCCSLLCTTMPQGQAISYAVQWIVVHLSAIMSVDEISGFVDLSNWKVQNILGHIKRTGDINVPKHQWLTLHKSLQDEETGVLLYVKLLCHTMKHLFNTLSSTPDLYLNELWLELQERCGMSVSISTI